MINYSALAKHGLSAEDSMVIREVVMIFTHGIEYYRSSEISKAQHNQSKLEGIWYITLTRQDLRRFSPWVRCLADKLLYWPFPKQKLG